MMDECTLGIYEYLDNETTYSVLDYRIVGLVYSYYADLDKHWEFG